LEGLRIDGDSIQMDERNKVGIEWTGFICIFAIVVFTVIEVHIVLFGVVTPFSLVCGYQRFGAKFCLHF
jgi:hypothetical protein